MPCSSSEEYKTFYFNAGRLLSILYFLGANDCHYENLIAVKENLYLIDVETLFEPLVPFHLSEGRTQELPYGKIGRFSFNNWLLS